MALTIASPGTNTVQITTSIAGASYSSFSDLTQAVSDAITGVSPVRTTGWSTFDAFTTTASTPGSIIYTQVFRGLNKDGITYKSIILRWNTMMQEVNVSTCEVWDATNHIPQNESWTYFDSASIPYRLDATDIIIFLNPRWCILHTYMANEPSVWAGVVETQREDIADSSTITPAPCWGWVSSSLWMLGATSFTAKPLGGNDHTLLCMPRTRSGATSFNSAKGFACDYGVTHYPHWQSTGNGAFIYYLGNQGNKFVANTWDTSKRLVLPLKPIADYTATNVTNYGQIYGLKVLSPAGLNMNKIQVNIDADGNYNPSGTLSDHWLLNNHWKNFNADNAGYWSNPALIPTTVSTGWRPEFLASSGPFFYITNGLQGSYVGKVNVLLGTYTFINSAYQYFDIKYDGERYMYVGSTNGISRIDTRDDSITHLAISNGCFTFTINSTHIICAPYNTSATPIITRVLRNTFAVDGTNGSIQLTTFTESVRITDMVNDHQGNTHMVAPVTTAGNYKIVKMATNAPAAPTYATFAQYVCANTALQVVDANNIVLWQAVNGSTMYRTTYNPLTMAIIGSVQTVGSCSGLTANHKMNTFKISGMLYAVPRSSSSANVCFMQGLGSTITATMSSAPIATVDNYGSTANLSYASSNNMGWWDGSRIIGNFDTGLRYYANVNGNNQFTGYTLGQATIPA